MPLAPVHRLKKDEILWLADHKCKHSHTYLEHFSCYISECPDKGKIGFLDIETSNLAANYGIMYCYAIKEQGGDIIYSEITTKEIKSDVMDKKLTARCINDIKKFDIIVTYYGTKFDIPFIRTRAVHHDMAFPPYGAFIHTDVYYLVRNKFRLNSNRLERACKCLLGSSRKTDINEDFWIRAMGGDKEAIAYIGDHCRMDVLDLEDLYNKVISYKKRLDTSG